MLPIPNYSLLLLDNSSKLYARYTIIKLQVQFSQVNVFYVEQKTSSKAYSFTDQCYSFHFLLAKYVREIKLLPHLLTMSWSLSLCTTFGCLKNMSLIQTEPQVQNWPCFGSAQVRANRSSLSACPLGLRGIVFRFPFFKTQFLMTQLS